MTQQWAMWAAGILAGVVWSAQLNGVDDGRDRIGEGLVIAFLPLLGAVLLSYYGLPHW